MVAWLLETKEYAHWGWNMATLGALGTVVFTIYQVLMLQRQNKRIWGNKSGEAVSVTTFSFMCFFLTTFALYGYYGKSFSVVFNGAAMAPFELAILVGLWKYKGYTKKEWLSVILSFMMVPSMILLPWKDEVYMVCSIGSVGGLLFQPIEIYREKKAGVIDIGLVAACLCSTVFWLVFTYYAGLMFVFSISASIFVILLAIVFLWYKYQEEEQANLTEGEKGCPS